MGRNIDVESRKSRDDGRYARINALVDNSFGLYSGVPENLGKIASNLIREPKFQAIIDKIEEKAGKVAADILRIDLPRVLELMPKPLSIADVEVASDLILTIRLLDTWAKKETRGGTYEKYFSFKIAEPLERIAKRLEGGINHRVLDDIKERVTEAGKLGGYLLQNGIPSTLDAMGNSISCEPFVAIMDVLLSLAKKAGESGWRLFDDSFENRLNSVPKPLTIEWLAAVNLSLSGVKGPDVESLFATASWHAKEIFGRAPTVDESRRITLLSKCLKEEIDDPWLRHRFIDTTLRYLPQRMPKPHSIEQFEKLGELKGKNIHHVSDVIMDVLDHHKHEIDFASYNEALSPLFAKAGKRSNLICRGLSKAISHCFPKGSAPTPTTLSEYGSMILEIANEMSDDEKTDSHLWWGIGAISACLSKPPKASELREALNACGSIFGETKIDHDGAELLSRIFSSIKSPTLQHLKALVEVSNEARKNTEVVLEGLSTVLFRMCPDREIYSVEITSENLAEAYKAVSKIVRSFVRPSHTQSKKESHEENSRGIGQARRFIDGDIHREEGFPVLLYALGRPVTLDDLKALLPLVRSNDFETCSLGVNKTIGALRKPVSTESLAALSAVCERLGTSSKFALEFAFPTILKALQDEQTVSNIEKIGNFLQELATVAGNHTEDVLCDIVPDVVKGISDLKITDLNTLRDHIKEHILKVPSSRWNLPASNWERKYRRKGNI